MDIIEFEEEMERRGYFANGNYFCGTYENRPFSVLFNSGKSGGKTNFTLLVKFGQKLKGKLFGNIIQAMKGDAFIQRTSSEATVLSANVAIKAITPFAQTFDRLLATVIAEADALGYEPPADCALCGRPGCDSYSYYGGVFTTVHANCVRQNTEAQFEKVQHNENNGSYALGILGAIIGGVVGSIPNVLSVVLAERIMVLLCALIPLGAYYGYKLFRGKMNGAALASTIAVSVLLIPIIEYLTYFVLFYVEDNYLLYPGEFIEVFTLYQEEFLPPMLQTALFVVLGVFLVFGIIRRGNKHVYADMSMTRESLRPMDRN